ncbi:hypothetical protein [Ralstonia sp. CP]|uniref:hypothetical protein n=1 Tax=Ralstonia sp. CP TaxID=3231757 RepID=UPI00345BD841
MNNEQFLDFFYLDFPLHLAIIAASLIAYAALFWRSCRSLADPLAFGVLAYCLTNVFAMYVFIDPALAAGYFLKLAAVFGTVFALAVASSRALQAKTKAQLS